MRVIVTVFTSFLLIAGVLLADDSRFEDCKSKLIKAQELEVLYDLDWKLPKEPKVVVGPTFFNLPFDAKENFALTVNCFLMAGDDGKFIDFNLLHWQTNKRVGRFARGKLKMD